MKFIYYAVGLVIAGGIATMSVVERDNIKNAEADSAKQIKLENKVSKIMPSAVYATINYSSALYADECFKKTVDYLKYGDRVEILKDKAREKYYIRHRGRLGWVKGDVLNIPPDPQTVTDSLSKEEIETYALDMRFKSDTPYYVWVDIARQKTYILKYNDKGHFNLIKTIICGTGKNVSPTVRGYFIIGDRGSSFYNQKLKSGAKYWVRFNESYLFHSIALNEDGSVKDPTLGKRCSDGCVRMSMEDIMWFYNSIPKGTSVRIS